MRSRQGAGKHTAKPASAQKYNFLHRLLADKTLSQPAKVAATSLLLKFHNTQTGRCNPSFAGLGKAVGRTGRAIFPVIAELRDAGWLTVESSKGGGRGQTNQYAFDFERAAPKGMKTTSYMKKNAGSMKHASNEPLKTTRPFGAGGGGEENTPQRAPCGALEDFEALAQLWWRPHGLNKAKAMAAFDRVIGDGVAPERILESAQRWVAAREAAYLPPLERWLADGAWQNEPPLRRNNHHHKPSAAAVAAGLAEAAARNERSS